jgi:hypothetical protein
VTCNCERSALSTLRGAHSIHSATVWPRAAYCLLHQYSISESTHHAIAVSFFLSARADRLTTYVYIICTRLHTAHARDAFSFSFRPYAFNLEFSHRLSLNGWKACRSVSAIRKCHEWRRAHPRCGPDQDRYASSFGQGKRGLVLEGTVQPDAHPTHATCISCLLLVPSLSDRFIPQVLSYCLQLANRFVQLLSSILW